MNMCTYHHLSLLDTHNKSSKIFSMLQGMKFKGGGMVAHQEWQRRFESHDARGLANHLSEYWHSLYECEREVCVTLASPTFSNCPWWVLHNSSAPNANSLASLLRLFEHVCINCAMWVQCTMASMWQITCPISYATHTSVSVGIHYSLYSFWGLPI